MAKSNPYFDDFISMIELSCQAAEHLQASLKNFQPETLDEKRKTMHEIEHKEDDIRHRMMARLVKEFVTPIDREDIIEMANELDNVTDKIEDILIRMYMYNIKEVPPAAIAFTDVIVDCCKALREAMAEFPNFRKSTVLKQSFINVNSMEEKGDELYISAVRQLFENEHSSTEIFAWSELFDRLEDCCDTCEHVADVMEIVVMKNS